MTLSVVLLLFVAFKFWNGDFQMKYNTLWIMGKTSNEITERYGSFDRTREYPDDDGLYRNTECHYFLMYSYLGMPMMGPERHVYYTIHFNEQGKADKIGRESGEWGN